MFTGTDIVKFFQENSALAVFLTVAIGFWIGKFRFGNFSLGIVTSVLLVGVVVGQMNIRIPEPAKTLFFLMFLFSIGYSVGPQFFRGLRKDGLPQVGFAVVVCVMCLLSVWGCAIVMGYDAAQAAGLLAGSQTMSAVIGAATDTIHELPGGRDTDLSVMPVCYAVTYIYGTAGSAWVLGTLGPRLLGGLIFGWAFVTRIGNVPLSLTVSGGVLIAGLICGWLRAKRPTLGGVPEPAVWFMNNVGLNVFIAIVGITTGPSFVRGFQEVGWSLFLVGAVATTIPLVAGIFIGKYLFRFNEAIVLGCVSGSRTTTAALGAVEETLESNVPAMGYTITYAIGNTLLIIWGVVIVLLVA